MFPLDEIPLLFEKLCYLIFGTTLSLLVIL